MNNSKQNQERKKIEKKALEIINKSLPLPEPSTQKINETVRDFEKKSAQKASYIFD